MYDDGILVNGPVVMSTTLTFATLGLSILGVLLQVLAWQLRSALWASLPWLLAGTRLLY